MIRRYLFFLVLIGGIVSQAQQPKLMLPIGHSDNITLASFSPDGKKVLTGSDDKTSKVWDVKTGALLLDLGGMEGWVHAAAFNPAGDKILTVSSSHVIIWNAETGEILHRIPKTNGRLWTSASLSPDGKTILTTDTDKKACIWDVNTAQLLVKLEGHTQSIVKNGSFSSSGALVVTYAEDTTARVWEVKTGKVISVLKGHSNKLLSARFSSDGTRVVTSAEYGDVRVWNSQTGDLLFQLVGHTKDVHSAVYSPDGKTILTASIDGTARLWDAEAGKLIYTIDRSKKSTYAATFSPDGKKIIIPNGKIPNSRNGYSKRTATSIFEVPVYETLSGKLIGNLTGHTGWVYSVAFSPDGKKIITSSGDQTARVWDLATMRPEQNFRGRTTSFVKIATDASGDRILTANDYGILNVWHTKTGKLTMTISAHTDQINSAAFSPDGNKILTSSRDRSAKVWDVQSGKLLIELTGHLSTDTKAIFSPDGSKIVTSASKDLTIWDIGSRTRLHKFIGHQNSISGSVFDPTGERLLSYGSDSTARLWDVNTGILLLTVKEPMGEILSAAFDPGGSRFITSSYVGGMARVWDAQSGKELHALKDYRYSFINTVFTPDGKRILTLGDKIRVWNSESGELLDSLVDNRYIFQMPRSIEFSPDKQSFLTTHKKRAKIWNVSDGKLRMELSIPSEELQDACFSQDGSKVFSAQRDGTIITWDVKTGNILYTTVAVDSADYLTLDRYNRYDGSQLARNLLYFTCQSEVITLDQVKDQLWIPGLVEKVLRGDSISFKTMDQLGICGLTPEVEELSKDDNGYRFRITPRRGGLGQLAVFVNGIEVKRLNPEQLTKTANGLELSLSRSELGAGLKSGEVNTVSVNAYTADNTVFARGFRSDQDSSSQKSTVLPNLYAIMVGVSDYKGDELDLKYAAKDAKDFANALQASARKLLNGDRKEHVFIYDLTTSEKRYQLPEKNSIRKVFEEIGQKATSNDILLIFFAGHGVMEGENKKFYFLTADASASVANNSVKEVSISTDELADWMKPQNIRAQKRILIFDACNSGQAIQDFVKIGGSGQGYLAARGDEQGQFIRTIDKLNERSGLFILSAAASNQSAYEMGRYEQGLLTYSLLKAIKEQPDILEQGKYLDLSRWFHAAEQTVTELTKETGARQQPQLVSNTNFTIGLVDEEVRSKIILPTEKALFTGANLQNADEDIAFDDLGMNRLLDAVLMDISSRAIGPGILFSPGIQSNDAWMVGGRYEVNGKNILARLNLRQGNTPPKFKFELKGTVDDLRKLADEIAARVLGFLGEKGN